jgi:HD-GYP domain-containing protein (c-di-GMP phosphodiesterase class II)
MIDEATRTIWLAVTLVFGVLWLVLALLVRGASERLRGNTDDLAARSHDLVESSRELEATLLETIETLNAAVEARDPYTAGHSQRVRRVSLAIGRELRLPTKQLGALATGALFHDIGKIGIPSRILAKAGPLTAEERALVETHPVLGERILAPIEQLGEVRHIVRCAHEHFDGTGYPDHLVGEQIPLESRIVLACDAFHAMTTDRPYRKSLGESEAKRRLVDASGTQFDPLVVDALLRVLEP